MTWKKTFWMTCLATALATLASAGCDINLELKIPNESAGTFFDGDAGEPGSENPVGGEVEISALACCVEGDPCGWSDDDSCDCNGDFAWDSADCSGSEQVGDCCSQGDPCGWASDGQCDCNGDFDWDWADCGSNYYGGDCCVEGDPCGYANDGQCDCYGGIDWDSADCGPAYECCSAGDPCGWANDGYCDCDGEFEWDSADCALYGGPEPMGECENGKYDPSSGLCWLDPPSPDLLSWQEAVDYCAGLYSSSGAWRLPTIGELRSSIRGCPDTEPGGACEVQDGCLDEGCYSSVCGCPANGGPGGAEGCYWDPAFSGTCGEFDLYWSSSIDASDPTRAWMVRFADSLVFHDSKITGRSLARCVR